MKTFADKVIQFNKSLHFTGKLPPGIRIMNPFRDDPVVRGVAAAFYKKFYDDLHPRHIILGINPGRFGGGITGIPFTDPKRLMQQCGIPFHGPNAHEPSSVFIYEMINAFGGPAAFYRNIYINSVCPLGFTAVKPGGKEVNYNYYDSPALTSAVEGFIKSTMRLQLEMGIVQDTAFCFGTGRNEKFLQQLNKEQGYFKKIFPLEHPRYIVQYKSKQKEYYISKYLAAFEAAGIR